MVRRLHCCVVCNKKFVSVANHPKCQSCAFVETEASNEKGVNFQQELNQPDEQDANKRVKLSSSSTSTTIDDVGDKGTNEINSNLHTNEVSTKSSTFITASNGDAADNDNDDGDFQVGGKFCTAKNSPGDDVIELLDDSNSLVEDSEDNAGSEGGDDFHCTQLIQDDTDEDVEATSGDNNDNCNDDENNNTTTACNQPLSLPPLVNLQEKLPTNNAPVAGSSNGQPRKKKTNQNIDPSNNDVCFICGMSLTKLKRRIDHIKRCSKKYGITGHDVKVNDTYEDYCTTAAREIPKRDSTKNKDVPHNPYTAESPWHGDADVALKLADQDLTVSEDADKKETTSKATSSTKAKQTTLASFVSVPTRNVNSVLIASARRMSKAESVVEQNKNKSKQQPTTSKKQTTLFHGNQRRGGGGGGGGFRSKRYWKNQRSKGICPAYKRIPGTDFVCDGFMHARSSLTQNYFLTHFHSDHYGGVDSSWQMGVIYCSHPTAKLVSAQLGVQKKFIHPLPMSTPVVIASSKGKPITVTLIDANHCPGAVMFLFEVGKRQILHVGDFRWNRSMMMQQPSLKPFFSNRIELDELFLDTTYCDPKYTLPSQEETINAIKTIFEQEEEQSRNDGTATTGTLHLFGAYTIGKERMFLSIASHFQRKVYVEPSKYRILAALDWPEETMARFTTNKDEASIWVVPFGHINMKKMPEYLPKANQKPFGTNHYHRVVGYRSTGWSMGTKPSSNLVSTRHCGNISIHSVPYSEHSSFPELVDCLECLKPRKIIPTVNVSKSETQVTTLLDALRQKQTTLNFQSTIPSR